MTLAVVLLAGGKGERMGLDTPKQFLFLHQKPVALHSLEVLLTHPEVSSCVVVCDPKYQHVFEGFSVRFASPGKRRQDSLFNGLRNLPKEAEWICTHDAARPFITHEMLDNLLREAKQVGAATLGMPIKWTLKETDQNGFVTQTFDRERVWEIQTPQIVKKSLLEMGFDFAERHHMTVTDDVSFAELLKNPVKMVKGSYRNLKITTPEDLLVADVYLQAYHRV